MVADSAAVPQCFYVARRGTNEQGERGYVAYWYYPSSGREEKSAYWRPTREQLATTMRIMHGAVVWRGETASGRN